MDYRDVKILWITLCKSKINAQRFDAINKNITIFKAHDAIDKKQIESVITSIKPNLICIDYDFPDLPGLQLLRQIRSNYSSIPVIMLTTQHSENLAVWAFRTGTRNYFVKPLRTKSLIEEINLLATQFNPEFCKPRINLLKHYLIPQEFHYFSKSLLSKRTVSAINYVEAHFHEKIREIEMASICGMSVFTFSRTFRTENDITFREFLTRYRIMQASEFLHNPQITISDVAQLKVGSLTHRALHDSFGVIWA